MRIKNIVLCFLSVLLITSGLVPLSAKEHDNREILIDGESIYIEDIKMHGTVVDDKVVIYDELLGIDHLNNYYLDYLMRTSFSIAPFGWENSGDILSRALAAIKDIHSSITWILRNGIWSLSLSVKSNYKTIASNHGYTYDSLFDSILILFYNDYQWRQNSSSMRNQYKCHWIGGALQFKNPWNLEPSKNDKSWVNWVLSRCN